MAKDLIAEQTKAISTAIAARPDYLPAIDADSAINQISQRMLSMPILSLNDDVFTLMEGRNVVHEFDTDELAMYFAHIHFFTQRRAFEGQWDEDDPQDPICGSDNNEAPMEGFSDPQSDACSTCWRSAKDTKRSDRCSYFRNSIVLIQYTDDNDNLVTCFARLRLNGNTLYGEDNRTAGVLNAESMIRMFRDTLEGELWYHPVMAYFDTSTKGAQNKLLFEINYTEFPTEDQAELIQKELKASEFIKLCQLTVPKGEDEDGGNESSAPTQRKTASQGKAEEVPAARGKKKATSRRSKPKVDEAEDDSSGSSPAPRVRGARGSRSKRGGKATDQSSDEGSASDESAGGGSVESDDERDTADPLADQSVMDMIGDVELP